MNKNSKEIVEDLDTFGYRLRTEAIRLYGSISKSALACSIHLTDLQRWVNNIVVPKINKLEVLEKNGFDIVYLITGRRVHNNKPAQNIGRLVPLFSSPARGGTWNMVDNDNHSTVFMPSWQVKGIKNPAMVEVVGMSMSPEIEYKDTVIFDMQKEVKDKDVVICTYESNTMIKRYRKRDDVITLESTNPKNKSIIVNDELVIHGVVIKVLHDMTKKREAF